MVEDVNNPFRLGKDGKPRVRTWAANPALFPCQLTEATQASEREEDGRPRASSACRLQARSCGARGTLSAPAGVLGATHCPLVRCPRSALGGEHPGGSRAAAGVRRV